MKIVIIDNYDSFTYNLSHLVKELGAEVTVVRNDRFELSDLEGYDKILLSPAPMPAASPSWASVSANRPSARSWAGNWSTWPKSTTAYRAR